MVVLTNTHILTSMSFSLAFLINMKKSNDSLHIISTICKSHGHLFQFNHVLFTRRNLPLCALFAQHILLYHPNLCQLNYLPTSPFLKILLNIYFLVPFILCQQYSSFFTFQSGLSFLMFVHNVTHFP